MPRDHIVLTGLKIRCIIGIFDWERKNKQDVLIDLKFPADIQKASLQDDIRDATDYKKIAKAAIQFVEKSRYQLIETLAEKLAHHLLNELGLPEIFLRASKPGAIRGSQNVGVEIHRTRTSKPEDLVYFSLGSNLNPAFHLVNALESLDQKFGLKKISHVYETSPVGGKKKQPFFWNLVAGVDTPLKPAAIRQWSSKLEKREGRVRSRDKYISRTLDVDVILWKTLVQKTKTHSLPHPDIQTKAFVLFPLLEITPALTLPDTGEPLIEAALRFHDRSQKFKRLPLSALPNGSRFPMGGVF